MFKIAKKEKSKVELLIDEVILELNETSPLDDEYELLLDRLKSLYELNSKENKVNISPDTIAVVAGNLLGIMLILKHEEFNIVTSKAMGFVLRGRA